MVQIKKINNKFIKSAHQLCLNSFVGEKWFTRETLSKQLKDDDSYLALGAFSSKQLIGIVVLNFLEPPKAWITLLAVDKKWRRQKIASQLLEKSLTTSTLKNYFLILVDVGEFSISAQKFYEANFFVQHCLIKEWFGVEGGAYLYSKNIKKYV